MRDGHIMKILIVTDKKVYIVAYRVRINYGLKNRSAIATQAIQSGGKHFAVFIRVLDDQKLQASFEEHSSCAQAYSLLIFIPASTSTSGVLQ